MFHRRYHEIFCQLYLTKPDEETFLWFLKLGDLYAVKWVAHDVSTRFSREKLTKFSKNENNNLSETNNSDVKNILNGVIPD